MSRLLSTVAVAWASAYFVLIHVFGGTIYVTLIALRGFWFALAAVSIAFGVWGSVFYLILIRLEAFDHVRDFIAQVAGKKKPGLLARVQMKILDLVSRAFKNKSGKEFTEKLEKKMEEAHAGREVISPKWIMIVFVILSPLFAVPLIRLSFPREHWKRGIFWVWIGTLVEVMTWFVPLYGGASIVIRFLVSTFG